MLPQRYHSSARDRSPVRREPPRSSLFSHSSPVPSYGSSFSARAQQPQHDGGVSPEHMEDSDEYDAGPSSSSSLWSGNTPKVPQIRRPGFARNDRFESVKRWLVLSTLVFDVMSIVPPIIKTRLAKTHITPYMDDEEVLALSAILILPLAMYRSVCAIAGPWPIPTSTVTTFLFFLILWVHGRGLHLSANMIKNTMDRMSEPHNESEVYLTTDFFDEHLGHWLWFGGSMGVVAVLLFVQGQRPIPNSYNLSTFALTVTGLIHGFTHFLMLVEGQVARIAAPYLAVLAMFMIFLKLRGKYPWSAVPAHWLYVVAYVSCAGWLIVWAYVNDWSLPEFSDMNWAVFAHKLEQQPLHIAAGTPIPPAQVEL